ncbi:PAS domain-containing protein [Modestobacter caceresii]|uniref:PAS domain-containing protein n=1 Tax=Modestobacter caceresii TaxID=1522368 RepID=UPI00068AAF2B|nr:PAS domain-containing protein [Modestobacter caceresii]
MARALGATLGQGWLFGRPGPGAASGARPGTLRLPAVQPADPRGELVSPFACLPARVPVREAPKALLIELSKQLERQALRLGETCVVASTFQEARHVTPATRLRYRDLVERVGFVAALGEDLPVEPMPGLRGADLAAGDPVRGEWDVVVLSPHFSAALLARDLGDDGPDMARRFAFALTYERDTVVRAARALLSRVAPNTLRRASTEDGEVPAVPAGVVSLLTGRSAGDPGEALLHRALAAVGTGVTIVDLRLPDQPLVYVNPAFERLAGQPAAELLGRNCRFLQDPDTDPAAVGRMRAAIAAGAECREVLLNRRADGSTWWNECTLTPVTDETGAVVQYIGIQTDVTDQVETERALLTERDRVRRYAARIAELDPRVGVPLSLAPPADGPQASTDSPGARRA